jgi:ketosteroid isomerase-like protein
MEIERALQQWVAMWNSYDLDQVDTLFLTDDRATYFSSEFEGLISGIEAVRDHHRRMGFVSGGKQSDNRLWVEDTHITLLGDAAIVATTWHFRRSTGERMRGPATMVYQVTGDGPRLAHLNFGNYGRDS